MFGRPRSSNITYELLKAAIIGAELPQCIQAAVLSPQSVPQFKFACPQNGKPILTLVENVIKSVEGTVFV